MALIDAMRGMVALVGDDFVVEFNDSARAHGRAETASLAEELIYFDMSHIFPLVSKLGILFLLSAESCGGLCFAHREFGSSLGLSRKFA